MEEIQYLEKPDWVSWDSVHECLVKAHAINEKKGFHMKNQDLDGEDIKRKLQDGHCFVAMLGTKVIGVHGLSFIRVNHWWARETVAYTCLDAILPEYIGTDVFFELQDLRMKYIKSSGVNIIQCNTAEQNEMVLKICQKKGYRKVRYSATGKGADYYSIIMAKWLNGCPFSKKYCDFMFNLSKYIIRAIWNPGYQFRFFRKFK